MEFLAAYHEGMILFGIFICCIVIIFMHARLLASNGKLEQRVNLAIKGEKDILQKLESILQSNGKGHKIHERIALSARSNAEAMQSVSTSLTQVLQHAETYRDLLVGMRDFYAALQHFRSGMEQGTLMSAELGGTLEQFRNAVAASSEAARDFNEVMARVSKDQEEMRVSLQNMQDSLATQTDSLKKLMGRQEFAVHVKMDESIVKNLEDLAEKMDTSARAIEEMVPALKNAGIVRESWFERLFK